MPLGSCIHLPSNTPQSVRLAAADVARDADRTGWPLRGNIRVRLVPGFPREHFRISARDGHIDLEASDDLGAVHALYRLSQRFMGVDPLYRWTGAAPVGGSAWPADRTVIEDGPKTFGLRGWFINDEDLLTGWANPDGPLQHPDYPMRVLTPEVMEAICESALRCGQNLLIPATYLDIDDPAQNALVGVIARRGLWVSQHHQESLGVGMHTLARYRRARGTSSELPTYLEDPDAYEEAWKHYVERYARYDRVVWQLGLRGWGDAPFWETGRGNPSCDADRGAVITRAYAHQVRCIADVLGTRDFPATATLWMEGSALHQAGHLDFPDGVTIVFSDFGPTQTFREDFRRVRRRAGRAYGIYYHVAFLSCGPHLVQGTAPARIDANYRAAADRGDTACAVLNVSSIRETALGVERASSLAWDMGAARSDAYVAWARRFGSPGSRDAERAATLYRRLYDAHLTLPDPASEPPMVLLDGMANKLIRKCAALLKGDAFGPDPRQNTRIYAFPDAAAFAAFYAAALPPKIAELEAIRDDAKSLARTCVNGRLLRENLAGQADLLAVLYQTLAVLAEAVEVREAGGQAALIQRAVTRAETLLGRTDRILAAAEGALPGWYANERLYDLRGTRNEVSEVTRLFSHSGVPP